MIVLIHDPGGTLPDAAGLTARSLQSPDEQGWGGGSGHRRAAAVPGGANDAEDCDIPNAAKVEPMLQERASGRDGQS
ncbi:MAG: hypothetical protein IPO81_08005 [Kouleothrix sp.]|nr:hypothetical protein [Kouleothrix sp.]